jgi:hypothetical protein
LGNVSLLSWGWEAEVKDLTVFSFENYSGDGCKLSHIKIYGKTLFGLFSHFRGIMFKITQFGDVINQQGIEILCVSLNV